MYIIDHNRQLSLCASLGLLVSLAACAAPATPGESVHEQTPTAGTSALGAPASAQLRPGARVSPQTQPGAKLTSFDPTVDGFKFVNSFQNVFGPVETSGLCGGMSYTALDYFNAKQVIPQQNYRPQENSVLQSYLYGRQETSIEKNIGAWSGWAINPLGVNNGTIRGNTFSREIGIVASYVDQGIPLPLGLDGTNGSGSHQVVAIGYRLDPNQENDVVYLYDPNHPAQMVTLYYNASAQVFTEAEYPMQDQWVGFFADTAYSSQTPPTIPEPIYADDGLIHELFIAVGTGNNALQNGANAGLEIFFKNGSTLQLSGLNLNEKWVPSYSETVRYPLSTPIDPRTIASLVLEETDSCGPWDITSARVQAVGSGTWVLAATAPGFQTQTLNCGAQGLLLPIVQRPPGVTSVSPAAAAAGATVVVTGTDFHTDGSSQLVFGTTPAATTCATSTQCTAVVPVGPATVPLSLTQPVNEPYAAIDTPPAALQTFTVPAGQFSIVQPPITVTGLSETKGHAGDTITVTGTGFSTAWQMTSFSFGAAPGSPAVTPYNPCTSTTSCDVPVPTGSGTVAVTATVGLNTSAPTFAAIFQYEAPSVTSISPTSGGSTGGTAVTITGLGLDSSMNVYFGGVASPSLHCNSPTSCWAITPSYYPNTGVVDTTVVVDGVGSATSPADQFTFSFLPPGPTSVSLDASDLWTNETVYPQVTLNEPAPPGGTVVTLKASGPSQAPATGVTIPATVTVPAGASSVTFPIMIAAQAVDLLAVFASTPGSAVVNDSWYVYPGNVAVANHPPSTVQLAGGGSYSMSFMLRSPAGSGGDTLSISSSSPLLRAPTTVAVPAGATSVSVPVSTTFVDVTTNVTVTLGYQGLSNPLPFAVTAPPACIKKVCLAGYSWNTDDCACELNDNACACGGVYPKCKVCQ